MTNRTPWRRERTWRDEYAALSLPATEDGLSRRRMLQGLLGVGGVAAIGLPRWLQDAADAAPRLGADDRILVVIMQGGGNDTLNTVIPAEDGRYRSFRPNIAVNVGPANHVGEGLYLHPNLSRLKARFDAGQVAIVRGVGEASDDRSHFSSMARWMAGMTVSGPYLSGWLGRWLDSIGAPSLGGVSVGDQGIPLHFRRLAGSAVGLPTTGDLFGADRRDEDGSPSFTLPVYDSLARLGRDDVGKGPWAQALAAASSEAIGVARQVKPLYEPEITSRSTLVRDLEIAARTINLGLGTRVIGVGYGDFDVHDNQRPRHDDLLTELDVAIARFLALVKPELRNRVVVMTFSEFGRRVEQNGSRGTDHGTAGSIFVVGKGVTGGLYGAQPSLRNLDERGDLKHTVDFRSVYATVLEDWLGADAREILGGTYENLGFLAQPVLCAGKRATIVGTNGDDALVGTAGADVIAGLGGNDTIEGLGGNDLICGGDGTDIIDGGDGDDTIFGDANSDRLFGGNGRDKLAGGTGNDRIKGSNHRDLLSGGPGADRLDGGRGLDKLVSDTLDLLVQQ